jgi:hypothetical protein
MDYSEGRDAFCGDCDQKCTPEDCENIDSGEFYKFRDELRKEVVEHVRVTSEEPQFLSPEWDVEVETIERILKRMEMFS